MHLAKRDCRSHNHRPPLGQADKLAKRLANGFLSEAAALFYNSLEPSAFDKYPLLKLLKEYALANGAQAALMCGSGSTVFAICASAGEANALGQAMATAISRPSGLSCVFKKTLIRLPDLPYLF